MDRLSRDYVDAALELFLSIIRLGITIIVIKDNQVFNKETIRDNWTKILFALVEMVRANGESVRKSGLVKDGWAKNREKAKDKKQILTSLCPAWLKRDGDKWVVIEEKAAVVKRVFKMAYDGHGGPSIARIFNEEKVPTMQRAEIWTNGPISAMLKNKAVIGTLSSRRAHIEDIPNYYPEIIKPELFLEVVKRVEARKGKGGQKFKAVRNLFSGMSYCKGSRWPQAQADRTIRPCLPKSGEASPGLDGRLVRRRVGLL